MSHRSASRRRSAQKKIEEPKRWSGRESGAMTLTLIVAMVSLLFVGAMALTPFDDNNNGIAESGVTTADVWGDDVTGAPNGTYRLAYMMNSGSTVSLVGWDRNPGYFEPSGDIVIPQTVGGYTVTALAESSSNSGTFTGCRSISSIVIPDSVTSIARYAFYDCNALSSVILPDSVTSIGEWAFYSCGSMSSNGLDLSNVTSIGNNAFYMCSALSSLELSSVISIGNNAFYYCQGLTSVSMPLVETIEYNAFIACPISGALELPKVVSIGDNVFNSISGITSVSMPLIQTIGTWAFYGTNITALNLPYVTSIGDWAFAHISSLTSLSMPMIQSLGMNVFNGTGLAGEIFIPSSLTSLSYGVFGYCNGITSFRVDPASTNFTVDNGALYDISKTTLYQYPIGSPATSFIIPDGVVSIGTWAFAGAANLTNNLVIPDSVTFIGATAFESSGFTGDVIISNVTEIPQSAFYNCRGLTSVSMPNVQIVGNSAFSRSGISGDLYLPEVTIINGSAFENCVGLTSVTMPKVVTIEGSAFEDCTGIVNVSMPAVEKIGNTAFQDCSSLVSVTFPSTLTEIRDRAFENCTSLTGNVDIPLNLTSLGYGAFHNTDVTSFTADISNPNYASSLGVLYSKDMKTLIQYPSGDGNTSYSVLSGVEIIEAGAFGYNKNIVSVTLPDTLTHINDSAFHLCDNLTSVNIPDSLVYIGVQAFYASYNLSGWINIPASLNSIGIMAFSSTSVEGFSVDSANTYYSSLDGVLYNFAKTTLVHYPCGDARKSFSIPSGVIIVGDGAFMGSTNLIYLSIPSTVTTTQSWAFWSSYQMKGVFFEGDLPSSVNWPSFSGPSFYSHGYKDASWWGSHMAFSENLRGAYYTLSVAQAPGESVFLGFTNEKVPSSTNNYNDPLSITQEWIEQFIPQGKTLLYSADGGSTWQNIVGVNLTADTTGWIGRLANTITYEPNGGNGTSFMQIDTGTVTLSDGSSFSRPGYRIIGWATSSGGPLMYGLSEQYELTASITLYAVWIDENDYFIRYSGNSNETTGTVPQTSGNGNVNLSNGAEFARTGYRLIGWSTTPGGNVEYILGGLYNLTVDTTLYAVWISDSLYAVIYDGNGAAEPLQTQTGSGSVTLSNGSIFTRSGYRFVGWSNTPSGAVAYYPGQTVSLGSNLVLYAVWTEDTNFIISYDPNGGTGFIEPQTGTGTVMLSDGFGFSYGGYKLLGWSTSPGGPVQYPAGGSYVLTGDVKLYAIWTDSSNYVISFDANGATGFVSPQAGTGMISLPDSTGFTYAGMRFLGWSTSQGGPVQYPAGGSYDLTADIMLYAIWTSATNNVITYNNNGGTGFIAPLAGTGSVSLSNGSGFSYGGYRLLGWSASPSGPVQYPLGGIYELSGDVVLYAIWTSSSNSVVTYHSNGGNGYIAPLAGTGSVTLSDGTGFANGGMRLLGWSQSASGPVEYPTGGTYNLTSDTVMYAIWAPGSDFVITYNNNGGTGFVPPLAGTGSVMLSDGSEISNSGSRFAGWATSSSGPRMYLPGATFTLSADTTLYAVWVANGSNIVSYNSNGGTGDIANVIATNGSSVNLSDGIGFTYANMRFLGWSASSSGPVQYAPGESITLSADLYLFAIWTDDTDFVITYNNNGGTGFIAPQAGTGTVALSNGLGFSNAGNRLMGWSTAAGGNVEYVLGGSYELTADEELFAVWTPSSNYVITYSPGAGTGFIAPQAGLGNVTLSDGTGFANAGMRFLGWSTTSGGSVEYAPGGAYNLSTDVILYAVWTSSTNYVITYDPGTGSGFIAPQAGTGTVTLSDGTGFTNAGSRFAGWATSSGGSRIYQAGASFTLSADTVLYAVWVADTDNIVSYNANGGTGSIADQTGTSGSALALSDGTGFVYANMRFLGWSSSPSGSVQYAPGQTVTLGSDLYLYAIWTADTDFVITYSNNGGTGFIAPQTGTGTVALSNGSGFSYGGNRLMGWSTSTSGPVMYDLGGTYNLSADVTLHAIWTPSTNYVITYNAGTGGTGFIAPQAGLGSVTLSDGTGFTNAGNRLLGWSTSVSGPVMYLAGGQYDLGADIILYAIWTSSANYIITYDSDGGTGFIVPTAGSGNVTLSDGTGFSNVGNRIAGWSNSSGGPKAYELGAPFNLAADTTLYAVWVADSSYIVSYDGNGASGSISNQTGASGSPLTLSDGTGLTYANMRLVGWSTSASGTVQYLPGQTITLVSDLHLYAIWTADTDFVITYNVNGGTGFIAPQTGTGTVTLSNGLGFSNAGNRLMGWSTTAGGNVEFALGSSYDLTADEELFAVWTPSTNYVITYEPGTGGTGFIAPQAGLGSVTLSDGTGFSNSGNKFLGWSTSASGAVMYAPGGTYNLAADTTLYAIWTSSVNYIITYDVNTGTGFIAPQAGTGTVTLSDGTGFSKAGSRLVGWATSTSGPRAYGLGGTYNLGADAVLYAVWVLDTEYIVSYSGNGATGSIADQTGTAGSTLALSDGTGFTYANMRFLGWSATSGGSVGYAPGQTITLNADLHLYAVWVADTEFVITYSNNGGTGFISPQAGTGSVTLSNGLGFSNAGNRLMGWSTTSGGSVEYALGSQYNLSADITLHAVWTPSSNYVVTYNSNGGTGYIAPLAGTTVTLSDGTGFSNPGMRFIGWGTTFGSTAAFNPGQTITLDSDLILYAVWTADTNFVITYDKNGGTGFVQPQAGTGTVTLSDGTGISKAGSRLVGWAASSTGPRAYELGSPFNLSADAVLYAVWVLDAEYIISYNGNGATGSIADQTGTSGSAQILSDGTGLTYANMRFVGWSTSSSGTVEYLPGQSITLSADMHLYAIWTADTDFVITYNSNGGTGFIAPQAGLGSVSLSNGLGFSNSGNRLLGWSTSASGPVMYDLGGTYNLSADVTLHAIWTPSTNYVVTYEPGTGGSGFIAPQAGNGSVTLSDGTGFSNGGNRLLGWSTSASGPVMYALGGTYDLTADVTLYAIWTANSNYVITYSSNGGTGFIAPQAGTGNVTLSSGTGFSKTDMRLMGWSDTPGGGIDHILGGSFNLTADKTMYAVWAPASDYVITYNGNGAAGTISPLSGKGTVTLSDGTGFTYANMRFLGWSSSSSGPVQYAAGGSFDLVADVTLHAIWVADTEFVITYDANGGTGFIAPQASASGTVTLSDGMGFSYGGNRLLGWSTNAGGPVEYALGSSYNLTADVTLHAIWTSSTNHVITYNAGTGGSGFVAPQAGTGSVILSIGTGFTNSGNKMIGWSTSASGPVMYSLGGSYNLTADVTLYAIWTANSNYVITYSNNGGTGFIAPQTGTGTVTLSDGSGFSFGGNRIMGWSTTSGGNVEYELGGSYNLTADVTLHAIWTASSNSVITYEPGTGGSGFIAPQSGFGTVTLSDGTGFTNSGSRILGWSTSASGPVMFAPGASYELVADITLYAIWTANTNFVITYDPSGGIGSIPPQAGTGTVTLSDGTGFDNPGLRMTGWSTLPGGSVEYELGGTYNLASDTIMYAVWAPMSDHVITYDGNGAVGAIAPQYGTGNVTLSDGSGFTYAGMRILGWSTNAGGSVEYLAGGTYNLTADVTLYAIWTPSANFIITYSENGGTGFIAPLAGTGSVTLSEGTGLARDGYRLAGWSTTSGGSVEYALGGAYNLTADGVLYAVWETFTITYHNDVQPPATVTQTGYGTVTLKGSDAFTRQGYVLKGWSTVSGGSIEYELGGTYSLTADTDLYAVWEEKPSTGGGSIEDWYIVIAAAVMAATLAILLFYWWRSSKDEEEDDGEDFE